MVNKFKKFIKILVLCLQMIPDAGAAPSTHSMSPRLIDFKVGVDVENLHPVMNFVLSEIAAVYAELNIPVVPVITSAAEPYAWRKSWSLHRVGLAVDVRGKNLPISTLLEICAELRVRLGKDFDVVLENYGAFHGQTHIHIEHDPK